MFEKPPLLKGLCHVLGNAKRLFNLNSKTQFRKKVKT